MTLLKPAPSRTLVRSSGWLVAGSGEHGGRAATLSAGLDRVRAAPSIPAAIRAAWELGRGLEPVGTADEHRSLDVLRRAARDDEDGVVAIAAVHAIARLSGAGSDAELRAIVIDDIAGLATHALWAMRARHPSADLVTPLAQRVARGGLDGTHAQWLLARWATRADLTATVLHALAVCLERAGSPPARRWLLETIGLVPGRPARDLLVRCALDEREDPTVRRVAVAAFAERTSERLPTSVAALAVRTDMLGASVRLVRAQRRLVRRGPHRTGQKHGIRVAQIHLGAVLDAGASHAGMGDAGGIATLLSRLGIVIAEQPGIAEVITIGRGSPGHVSSSAWGRSRHRFESVALESGEGTSFSGPWPGLVAVRRGLRAAVLAGAVPDVVHLRMADPGSLAAAEVARELAIPIVFTLAPDPHGPIAAAERAGTMDRRGFVLSDARDHLWFRMHLVDALARRARKLVLFPRPDLPRELRALVGVDISADPRRFTIVPEGVDTRVPDLARQAIRSSGVADEPAVAALLARLAALPKARHGLPLVMSVGRLNELKGMARIVRAFSLDPVLSRRANLVIVGGDLSTPTSVEAEELERIRSVLDAHPGLSDRVILLGHRPNDQVGLLLAVARHGLGPLIGPSGAYACGSRKEEFGLAIVEAMAAGLPVVAPREGGPATYVEDGVTGALVDTTDAAAIARGLVTALDLSLAPRTAARTRDVVERRFTLEQMARTLAAVYDDATQDNLAAPDTRDAAA
jgi:glycosyltransferase involved in cell wall biosynthesis